MTAAPRRTECAEEDRHKAQRQAGTQVSLWLFGYAKAHGLTLITPDAAIAFHDVVSVVRYHWHPRH